MARASIDVELHLELPPGEDLEGLLQDATFSIPIRDIVMYGGDGRPVVGARVAGYATSDSFEIQDAGGEGE